VVAVDRIVLWGFSFGAGHAIEIAARDRSIAALLLLCPFLDGPALVSAMGNEVATHPTELGGNRSGRSARIP
jgi:pimeloyl-ACP methyl ester carboxylesterase